MVTSTALRRPLCRAVACKSRSLPRPLGCEEDHQGYAVEKHALGRDPTHHEHLVLFKFLGRKSPDYSAVIVQHHLAVERSWRASLVQVIQGEEKVEDSVEQNHPNGALQPDRGMAPPPFIVWKIPPPSACCDKSRD